MKTIFIVNSVGEAGALAALDDHEHSERTLRNNSEQLALLTRQLRELGFAPVESWANFIYFETGEDASGVGRRLQRMASSFVPSAEVGERARQFALRLARRRRTASSSTRSSVSLMESQQTRNSLLSGKGHPIPGGLYSLLILTAESMSGNRAAP